MNKIILIIKSKKSWLRKLATKIKNQSVEQYLLDRNLEELRTILRQLEIGSTLSLPKQIIDSNREDTPPKRYPFKRTVIG